MRACKLTQQKTKTNTKMNRERAAFLSLVSVADECFLDMGMLVLLKAIELPLLKTALDVVVCCE